MAGTPLTPTSRYIPPGTRELLWVASGGIANTSAPTRVELDAGIDLTAEVADYAGFAETSDFVETPDLGSRWISQIPGQIKPPSSTITFWASSSSDDIRSILPAGTKGYVVIFPEGDGPSNGGPGTKMDIWPVTVGSESMEGKAADPAQRMVSFATTGQPALNVTIPA